MTRRLFLSSLLGASVSGAMGVSGCAFGEDTHDLEVTTVPVRLGLEKPLRMVALGDIHYDPLCEASYIARVVETINRLEADLIVYTGDFVTRQPRRMVELAVLLAKAQARLGAFTCAGNHELWTDLTYVVRVLDRYAGIRMLRNSTIPLPGGDGVYLTGLDSYSAGRPNPAIMGRTPAPARHIVLAHEPDSFAKLTDPRIRLQISGHTHGGQVRLPLIGALVLPVVGP